MISLPAEAQKLPPIKSPQDAAIQLRFKGEAKQLKVLANLKKACSGRFRRALKDAPMVLKSLSKISRTGTPAVKKATMDCFRCFSPSAFSKLLAIQIVDSNAKVVSYAAEVSARVTDAAMLSPLIAEWEKRARSCLAKGLKAAEVERCVWLSYAPGASAKNASAEIKEKLSELAVAQFESPYPKVREVAVETLAASGSAKHAPSLKALILKEKKGQFERNNDAALLQRFEKRLKKLKSSK